MARKYSRDNRGRFASSGTGATARGGRLKTAGGNKRATQTMSAKAAGGAGVVKGRPARTVAGQSVMRKLAKAPPAATPKPTRSPGSRIRATRAGGVSRARLSGQKMNEGAGKRGAARQQRQQTMAIQRQMLGRVKPGKSAEPLATGGTLAARASLGRARAKAGPGASPAQRGAVTRAGTYLKASKERNRTAVKGAMPKGTVAKPKGLKPGAVNPAQSTRLPAAQRPGSLTNTLGNTLRNLARADAARIRELESITGQKFRQTPAGASAAKEAGARVRAVAKGGKVGPTLRAGLRELAQSDARSAREMASIVRDATPKLAGGKGGKAIGGGKSALPGGKARAAAAKPTTSNPLSNSPKTNGQIADLTKFRNSQRTQLKEINRKIKEAGPQAGGLRLQKLKIQDRLNQLNSDLVRAGATTAVRGRRTKKS